MNSIQEIFNELLADPEHQDAANSLFLQQEIRNYPFCQSLQLSYARYCQVFLPKEANSQLGLAAIYAPDRTVLFNLVNLPVKVKERGPHAEPVDEIASHQPAVNQDEDALSASKFTVGSWDTDHHDEFHAPFSEHDSLVHPESQPEKDQINQNSFKTEHSFAHEPSFADEVEAELATTEQLPTVQSEAEVPAEIERILHKNYTDQQSDDLYDHTNPEPVIDQTKEEAVSAESVSSKPDASAEEFLRVDNEKLAGEADGQLQPEDNLTSGAEGSDFEFRKSRFTKPDLAPQTNQPKEHTEEKPGSEPEEHHFSGEKENTPEPEKPAATVVSDSGRRMAEDIPVRKTFLYWLKKTQKGYFLNSSNSNSTIRLDEDTEIKKMMEVESLEKNYQANIFHLAQIDPAESAQTIEFDLSKKEDRIIEKFLRDDVQHIQPNRQDEATEVSSSVQTLVDQASSDSGIVTKTLAEIYRRQRLYDKAIDAYEELSLKLPNKSAYFASLIEDIRKEADKKEE